MALPGPFFNTTGSSRAPTGPRPGLFPTPDWDLNGYYPIVDVLRIDPINSNIVYAGTNYEGVFKSSNNSLTWTAANSGMEALVNDLAIDPSNSTTLYAATYYGVFKSTNGGMSWTAINNGMPERRVISLAVDPANSEIVYAGTYSQGVFKSINGGSTWVSVNSGLQNTGYAIDHLPLVLDSLNPGTIYAGTFNGVFKSTNGGTSWSSPNSGFPPSTHVFALAATALNETSTIFVPVLVSTPGLNGSLFTSEMIMTNKGSRDAILDLSYTSAFGGGTGKGSRPPGGRASTHCPGRHQLSPVPWESRSPVPETWEEHSPLAFQDLKAHLMPPLLLELRRRWKEDEPDRRILESLFRVP